MTTTTMAPRPGIRSNPAERVLWILATLLVIGSGIAAVWAQSVFSGYNSGGLGPLTPIDVTVAQVLSMFGPGAFTGGIVLAGLALTTRALRFDGRAEPAQSEATTTPSSASTPSSSGRSPSAPGRPASAAPVDHSIYMRPQQTE